MDAELERKLGISMADIDDAIDDLFEKPRRSESRPKPEIVERRPFAEYHGDPTSIGAGGLRLIQKSPLHYWHAHLRPDRETPEPTDAQRLGSAIHCATLEPDEFAKRYLARPKMDRRTTQGKAAYAEFLEALADRTELGTGEDVAALDVARAVRSSALGAKLLGAGRAELSVYWTDRETGVRCRMRPDFVPDTQPVIVDLKSTTDAGFDAFTTSAWRNGYHVTAAWYVDGWKAATGEKRDYVFSAWEKEPPYASQWFYADPLLLEAGRVEYRRLLKRYAACKAANEWPGYDGDQLQPLEPPAWAMDRRER